MAEFMKNSRMPEKWIRDMCAANPPQPVFVRNERTGQMDHNGNYLTGPVRLSWPNLFKRGKNMEDDSKEGKFGTVALFPPPSVCNMQALQDALGRVLAEKFASAYNPTTGQYYGVQTPFRDQGEKSKFDGYQAGSWFATFTSNFQCQVVDPNNNPIVDERRVYPGVWAILAVNPYSYTHKMKKGVALGLQSVMIIGDDTSFAGSGSDPRQDFAKVTVTAATNVSAAFGATPPMGAPPAPSILGAGGGPVMPPHSVYNAAPSMPPVPSQYSAAELEEMRQLGIVPQ